jgi:16S rRNA (uracil1498-N3)-methyltransferase
MIVFDGSGKEFNVVIEKLTRIEALLKLFDERQGVVPNKNKIVLCQSLVKKDKMEWVVEKATELGISKIMPIVSERSEKRGLNMERVQKIAIEASEQSGRADIPEVLEPVDLTPGLLYEIKKRGFEIIAFDPSGVESYKAQSASNTCIFIGPEGGWSDKELSLFSDAGAQIYSLGPLTLRAETAAVAALAKICL